VCVCIYLVSILFSNIYEDSSLEKYEIPKWRLDESL